MHGLNEYDYGARQYDPAIGKFTTMDPLCEKYYHISPYAYCGGNPVNAVDPDGRYIAWIDENNDEWTFDINQKKFLNSTGEEYSGKNKFFKRVKLAFDKILSTSLGENLIKTLGMSEYRFLIEQNENSKFNSFNHNNAYKEQIFSDPKQSYLINQVSETGSGGTISWNPKGEVIMTTEGECVYPEIDLAHEMFHALDSNFGRLDDRKENNLSRSEWMAVYYENLLRQQMGYPLRTYYNNRYNPNTNQYLWLPPTMLDKKNNPIKRFW